MTNQLDMFLDTPFREWADTEQGRYVTYLFIRLAMGCKKRDVKMGAKAIWEKIRWHYRMKKDPAQRYLLNNTWCSPMAHLAEEKRTELVGYFEHRESPKAKKQKVMVFPKEVRVEVRVAPMEGAGNP